MSSILVVEDNPVNMRLVRLLLRSHGYLIHEATTGQEALAWLRGGKPDLILLDMQLPGMDGFALAMVLKADAVTGPIPLVAVTAFAMKGDEERIREGGCEAYISKPISVVHFLETIRRLMG